MVKSSCLRFSLHLFIILGCIGVYHQASADVRQEENYLLLQTRATDLERKGELNRALEHLMMSRYFSSDNALVDEKINVLKEKIHDAAEKQFKAGMTYLAENKTANARRAFLSALFYNPGHRQALNQLKSLTIPPRFKHYTVKKGDTPNTIAAHFYHDETWKDAILFFNNLAPGAALPEGMTLNIPIAGREIIQKKSQEDVLLSKARALFKKGDNRAALEAADKVLSLDPSNRGAGELTAAIYLKMANQQIEEKQYAEAKDLVDKVPRGFKNRKKTVARLDAALQDAEIEAMLEDAWTAFNAGDYEKTIHILKKVQSISPENKEAINLFNTATFEYAKKLYNEEKDLSALAVIENADKKYKGVESLTQKIEARINARAQEHYRKGVKYFLNENLEQAIFHWEATLSLNPDHAKAGENIVKARRLLNKIEKIE